MKIISKFDITGTYHYDSGQIMFERPMLNGKRHGMQRWFWGNGNIHYCFLVLNGLHAGIYQNWNVNKTRHIIDQTKNNMDHGAKIKFIYQND